MREITAAMLGLHQTDAIEIGLGEESVEEEPSFGWFMYTKGGMGRMNVHVDSGANQVLAGFFKGGGNGRRGHPLTTSLRVFSSSKPMFRCPTRMLLRKWYRHMISHRSIGSCREP